MAKNLIPSCCKALAIHQKSSAAKFGHMSIALCRLATLANDTSRSASVASSSKNQRQKVNYSQAAEAARQQSTDSQRPIKQNRKQESSSDVRKRLNHIRYFYADPEIDKAIERPIIRLNPMTLMYMGVSNDNSHLFQSATYLRNEMPIRLAHFVKELRNLPFIVACNPAMLEIHERCINTFHSFEKFDREIKDIATERSFNQVVFHMLEMNKDLLALLCDGFKDARRYVKNDEDLIRTSLNKILSARLGIRLLGEHHIALNRQSNLNKMVLPKNDDDESDDNAQENVDQYVSKYVQTTNGNSGSGGDSTRSNKNNSNWIGIVNKRFSPKQLVENSGKLATRICLDKYGIAPRLKIDGHTNAQFAYLPLPLEYILPELLKNAFRATIEHHNKGSSNGSLPDVSVTIAVNEKDFIIRIRDRGGGIPHCLIDKIFDFHFTTADEKFRDLARGGDQSQASSTSSNDEKFSLLGSSPENSFNSENSGMGILCEATGTRGYSLMHGYGFGLPTSKAYAEYLGGSLTCQSMQGIGSDFYLRLGLLDVEHEIVRI